MSEYEKVHPRDLVEGDVVRVTYEGQVTSLHESTPFARIGDTWFPLGSMTTVERRKREQRVKLTRVEDPKSYHVADGIASLINNETEATAIYYARGEKATFFDLHVGDKTFVVEVRETESSDL